MANNAFDRFSVESDRPDMKPNINEEGVVSGEIGGEPSGTEDSGLERLGAIGREASKDAQLAEIFAAAEGEDSRERASNILDRINAMRRELAGSDADEAFQRDRDRWLSDIANRLRELL